MKNQINISDQNTQQIGQNPINQPVYPEKPKTNYLLIVGIVLACFVIFGIGGYFLGIRQWSTNNYISEENLSKPRSAPQVLNIPIQDETANWKTYTNEKYSYLIKYPPTFSLTEQSPEYVRFSLGQNLPDQPSSETYLSIQVKNNPQNLSLAEWEKQNVNVVDHAPFPKDVEYIENKGTIFQITLVIIDREDKDGSIATTFNQILSTFKITGSTNTNAENQIGYIKSVFDKNNGKFLTIDYIQWLSQIDGTCRSSSEENSNVPVCNPNGYLIVNDNPQLRTFEISGNVVIDFSDFKNAGLGWKKDQQLSSSNLTLSEFQEIFSGSDRSIAWLRDAVYRVEIKGNKITKIKYQYQP